MATSASLSIPKQRRFGSNTGVLNRIGVALVTTAAIIAIPKVLSNNPPKDPAPLVESISKGGCGACPSRSVCVDKKPKTSQQPGATSDTTKTDNRKMITPELARWLGLVREETRIYNQGIKEPVPDISDTALKRICDVLILRGEEITSGKILLLWVSEHTPR